MMSLDPYPVRFSRPLHYLLHIHSQYVGYEQSVHQPENYIKLQHNHHSVIPGFWIGEGGWQLKLMFGKNILQNTRSIRSPAQK